MKKLSIGIIISLAVVAIIFSKCNNNEKSAPANGEQKDSGVVAKSYGGFESQVKWGEHLVGMGHCNDCHTPKKMTAMGPDNDSSLLLSGHPAAMPAPVVDRKEFE